MHISSWIDRQGIPDVSGCFSVRCSAGTLDGGTPFTYTETASGATAQANGDGFRAVMTLTREGDVFVRRDTFQNTSDAPIFLYHYAGRLAAELGETEVYTQYSHWCRESSGRWQPLVTAAEVTVTSVRTTAGGVPMLALFSPANAHGLCCQLLPNAAFTLRASRRPLPSGRNAVVLEAGLCGSDLCLEIAPGETIDLPVLLLYDFDNKTDLGCTKLHTWWLNNGAKRPARLPVIFNSWFSDFGDIVPAVMRQQVDRAAALGAEYFVVDAGWFGMEPDWWGTIGDWRENPTGAFGGTMASFADYVREKGMIFGLWVEAERARPGTPVVTEHPEFFLREGDDYFWDFADPEAVACLTDTLEALINRYGIGFLKFDFNADCHHDPRHAAFYRHHAGHRRFLDTLRERHPDLYLENCASGGNRMDLWHGMTMDGTWFSDNQNPYDGIRILRDSLLRLPPMLPERWLTLRSVSGFPLAYADPPSEERLVTVAGPTWKTLMSTSLPYLQAFSAGGPLGITCDLTRLSEETLTGLRAIVADFKEHRDFYRSCVCRPLAVTADTTVLQYTDLTESAVLLQVFWKDVTLPQLTVYPRLTQGHTYGGVPAARLCEDGVNVPLHDVDGCGQVWLTTKEVTMP